MHIQSGTLHLFPCPIIDDNTDAIPAYVINAIHQVDFFIAERAKTARRFLKRINHPIPLQEIEIFELDKKDSLKDKDEWLNLLISGKEIGFLSEAGVPCVADPGERIVSFAHQVGAKVKPYVGPSSILLALIGSGLNGEQFRFHTYLPIQQGDLTSELRWIVKDIQKSGTSHIFIETPYRNEKTFQILLKHVPGNIALNISVNLTGPNEVVQTKTIREWKSNKPSYLHKQPAIFILGSMQ